MLEPDGRPTFRPNGSEAGARLFGVLVRLVALHDLCERIDRLVHLRRTTRNRQSFSRHFELARRHPCAPALATVVKPVASLASYPNKSPQALAPSEALTVPASSHT
eukprot:1505892-Pleurochrysis_carterae.AAC.2